MSRKIHLSKLDMNQRKKIIADLTVEQKTSKFAFSQVPKKISLYDLDEKDNVIVPFSYSNYPRPERNEYPSLNIPPFEGKLREEQIPIKIEAISCLNKTGSVLISAYPGFGKTCIGINIACKIGLPTLILCHRIVLINQWFEAICKFCPQAPLKVLLPQTEEGDSPEPTFFNIINAQNLPKFSQDFLDTIGFVIVDECHLIMAEKTHECMKQLFPRYVLGLSATP